MMMCVNPKIVIPFPFKDKETVVFIKEDLSNFQELVEYYRESGSNEIEDADGQVKKMKFTVKLVNG